MKKYIRSTFAMLLLLPLALIGTRVARADSVITNCSNDSQLTAALASGGIITFNCGTTAITFSGQKTIAADVTIDGGGKITLSGANTTRLFWVNSGKALTLKNIVVTNGYAGANYGGCIYVDGGGLGISNSTIQNCKTNNYAGGAIVSPLGNVTIEHSVFKTNNASSGGAISATGSVTILDSQFLNNSSTFGGALSVAANVVISNSIFNGNQATGNNGKGGAIATNGNTTIHASSFGANQAPKGGAIYVELASDLTMDAGTLLHGNSATDGGGLYTMGRAKLTNVTLSGNSATNYGGGILIDGSGPGGTDFRLVNATLSGNSALVRGGGYALNSGNGSYSLLVSNDLFAKGTSGANCDAYTGGGYNLSDDNSCRFGYGQDNRVLNLGPLAYNGTSIQTHLPKPDSPAIDGGTSSGAPATDARGNPRQQGLAVDVGAVEVCTFKPNKPILTSPLNNAKYKGTQVALNWDDAACADKYKITIKDAATGTKVQGGNSGKSDFKTKALTKGKSYLWYVQACNTVGCTKSDTRKFTVK